MPSMPFAKPLLARDPDQHHRASTPLELLFDLCFVVAISQLVGQWHHAAIEGHFTYGILRFGAIFFAIWWAWMNFTWFASAYDNDDVLYRFGVMTQIAGNLVIAAGVPRAFSESDFTIMVLGYTLMRVGLVGLWLRVWRADPVGQAPARRYAIGVSLVQVLWLAWMALDGNAAWVGFVALVIADLSVPVIAEFNAHTPWHPFHIAERYGLFTLIVLGESVLGTTVSIQQAIDESDITSPLVLLAIGALLIFFGMWWLYFDREPGEELRKFAGSYLSLRSPIVLGYGHYFIFAFAAAAGGGLEIAVDHEEHVAHITAHQAAATIAIPVALFLTALLCLRMVLRQISPKVIVAYLVGIALVLATILIENPVLLIGLIATGLVACVVHLSDPAEDDPEVNASGQNP